MKVAMLYAMTTKYISKNAKVTRTARSKVSQQKQRLPCFHMTVGFWFCLTSLFPQREPSHPA